MPEQDTDRDHFIWRSRRKGVGPGEINREKELPINCKLP
jgi:hypothetical protein